MNSGLRRLAAALLCLGLVLPFAGKPVHVDDANFLVLAAGAAADPWRPHAIRINWQGRMEPAFDVLSNPPGIAWWLAPLHGGPEWALHLWMLPWLALALWGASVLGGALGAGRTASMLTLGTAPVVVLAAGSLTPDLPLLACTLAGTGGFLASRRRAWAWALLAGCAACFRYSGLCLLPLLLYAGLGRRRWRAALAALVPILLLCAHDLAAYGRVHLLAMGSFQSTADSAPELARKAVASVAMLGGAGLLPLLPWNRRSPAAAAGGALAGLCAGLLSGQGGVALAATILATAAGGVALSGLRLARRDDRLLAAWTLGGLAFLLLLRFAAARYWLPFLAAPALAALRLGPGRRRLALAVAIQCLLSLGMAVDDQAMARAERDAAGIVGSMGTGTFAGHWGWQYYMERAGWRPLQEGARPAALHAVSAASWPQDHDPSACMEPARRLVLEDRWWGPRLHSVAGGAGYHSYLLAGHPPVQTYAPWSLAADPYDTVTVYRSCAP